MPVGRQYPSQPLVGAGVVVVRGGRALLVRRRNPPNEGRWAIPGGLVELGEEVEDAARREAREELGVDVAITSLLAVTEDVIRDRGGRIRYHYVLVDYLARQGPGRIRLNDESSEFRWFTLAEVERTETAGMTRAVVLRALGKRVPHRPGHPRDGLKK